MKDSLRVSIADLVLQYNSIKDKIEDVVTRTLRGGSYIMGENVKALEAEFAHYCGVGYALGVNSGTDALWLSLQALGIEAEDEVIVPAFTIIVDAAVVCQLKARPVFVDIDPATFNLDPGQLSARITKKTRAIIVVDLFGQTADMEPILAIAKRHNIPVIEDACQAIGAQYSGRKAGALGDLGCFSFYPTKNLGAYGDGGMVTTNDKTLADKIRLLRSHGDAGQYNHIMIGHNSRLDEIQAAILRVKMQYVDSWNRARRSNAQRYNSALGSVNNLTVPLEHADCYHVYHQYTIRIAKRDELRRHLQEHGITSLVYYPIPLHLQKALGHLGYHLGDFPESESTCQQVLSLPVYAELESAKLDYVIEQIKSFFKAAR